MKLEINSESLHNFLQGKREYIGGSWINGLINIGGGVSFGVTIYSANLNNNLINMALYGLASLLFIIGLIQFFKNIGPFGYDYEKLYHQIKNLSISQSKYSLVAILNTFEGDFSNKVLLNYKKDWKTYMFLSFRTAKENDEDNVVSRIAGSLKVTRDQIQVRFLAEEPNQPKYSPEYKTERTYYNRYYQVYINSFPEPLKKSTFSIDKVKYKWMTLEEMLNNQKIRKNNSDVVSVFEKYIFSDKSRYQVANQEFEVPQNICIRLNRKCNLSCEFCLADCESEGLQTFEIKKILDILKENGVKKARLAGGEPTIRPDFIEIVKYCTDLGFDTIVVYSNLIELDSIFSELITYPISITTSIHGNEDIHDSITKRGAYKTTFSNIKKLINANINVAIHMVIMEKNYMYADHVIQEAISVGVKKISFQTLIPRGRGQELFNVNGENIKDVQQKLESLQTLKEKYSGKININFINLYEKNYYVLETDGNIYLQKSEESQDTLIGSLI